MEEIIELLSAYYTALVEKGYITQAGHGTPRLAQETPYDFSYFLSGPDYSVPGNEDMDRDGMIQLIQDRYYFWLATKHGTGRWDWVWYKNGGWECEDAPGTIPEDNIPGIIHRSANRLGLELKIEHPSEMSMAARLLDDEMQYEI